MGDIVLEVKRRRWTWLGHVLRMKKGRHPLEALSWTPPWEAKQGQTTWHLEENNRGGDEGGWQDLEGTPLAGPGPDCLETACWRLMLLQEPRGLSE